MGTPLPPPPAPPLLLQLLRRLLLLLIRLRPPPRQLQQRQQQRLQLLRILRPLQRRQPPRLFAQSAQTPAPALTRSTRHVADTEHQPLTLMPHSPPALRPGLISSLLMALILRHPTR